MVTEKYNTKMNAGLTTIHQFIVYTLIREVISSASTRLFESIFTEVINTTKTQRKNK